MSSDDIEPYDWYRRFFGRGRGGFFEDIFRGFDQMRREMEREFEDIEKSVPRDLVREYGTPQGGKVREVGPLVYGYSITETFGRYSFMSYVHQAWMMESINVSEVNL